MHDPLRWHAMGLVEALSLPQGCIGAGFVRNLVWDHCHEGARDCRQEDIDVLFFDQSITDAAYDAEIEATLRDSAPDLKWSVKNQARMHIRNKDAPYVSVEDAMRFWPETATAVAAMRSGSECIFIAPFGLSDLERLILRPTSAAPHKIAAFHSRVAGKNWRTRWPKVRVMLESDQI
ncbi:MAG: nucleotidyltransferase family protein [Rhodobacteraceae bacterium]|nr:nucleotidyltransferase family protein [Paracoccaceae bacterium]